VVSPDIIQKSPTWKDPDHEASLLLDATPQWRYLFISRESRSTRRKDPCEMPHFSPTRVRPLLDGTSSSSTSLFSSDHPTSGGNHTHTHNMDYSVIPGSGGPDRLQDCDDEKERLPLNFVLQFEMIELYATTPNIYPPVGSTRSPQRRSALGGQLLGPSTRCCQRGGGSLCQRKR
jgi:hypothetical protein